MKKIFTVLLIASIIILTSCEKTESLISDSNIDDSGSTDQVISVTDDWTSGELIDTTGVEDTTPEISVTETEDALPPRIDLSFLINLDWSKADGDEDEFEFKVFALPDYLKGIYSNSLIGDITFIDEQFNPVKLPFQPIGWIYIYAYDLKIQNPKPTPVGYALEEEGNDNNFILMLADGTIPTDSDGEYIRPAWSVYDGFVSIFNNGGMVVIEKKGLFGIYDLKKQQEALPCEYESISPIDSIFYAVKDGQSFLYSKYGDELYSFGGYTEKLHYKDISEMYEFNCNTVNRWSSEAEYYLNVKERLFYKISDNESGIEREYVNGSISAWGDYIVNSIEGKDDVYVTDRDGNVLYRGICYNRRVSGEYLVLYATAGFIILDKDFNERKFPVELLPNDSYASGSVFYKFDGELAFYVKDYWDKELYSVDEAGNVVKVKEFNESVVYVNDEVFDPVYEKDEYYYLQDVNGNILLSYRARDDEQGKFYGMLEEHGDFVFLMVPDGGESTYTSAVYSLDGKLLQENIYGVTSSTAPGGGILVYTAPDNCIALYPDGSSVPVSAAPVVERLLWSQGR